MLVNIRSLNKHLEELQVFLQTFESLPTVICLVETWIQEGSHEEHFNISGYQKIIAKNRVGIGGGVAMFCREDIFLLDSFPTNYYESLGIKIRTNNENYTLITYYVPPGFNKNQFLTEFDSYLETMVDANQNLIICGDFNIDQLSLTPIKKRFEDVISSNGINLMDSGITRETSTTKSSLDLFLTNINKNLCIVNSISYDITDHYPVFFSLTKSMIKPKIKASKRRSMSPLNNKILFEKYKKELENNLIIFQNNNRDQSFNAFCNCLHFVVDKHQPLVEIKQKKNRNQWVTNRKKNLFAKRNNARTKWLRTQNNIDKNRYVQLKSKSTQIMNDTKKHFIQNKIQNCGRDSRKMYKIINNLIGRNRSDVSYNLVFNNIGTDDPSSIADYFNEHFVNVADEIVSKLPQISFPSSNYAEEQSMMLHETNLVEVLSQIASLQNSFAHGVDLITNTFIKRFDRTLAPFLVNYINESFLSGVFPNSLKRATIQPHFKTGSKTDANNYRPISILPSFGKVFEKIMKIKILNYIEKFKILGENQFGFRNRRSTVDALVNVVENIRLEKEKGNNSTTVFLDLKKAFDTVNHSLLLKKLENFGIRGQVLSWFSSYLKSRTQCVIWKNRISKELIVKNGVPQGSVLGPVLFILYFNDFVDACKLSTPYFFADDTSLLSKADQPMKN